MAKMVLIEVKLYFIQMLSTSQEESNLCVPVIKLQMLRKINKVRNFRTSLTKINYKETAANKSIY